MILNKNYYRAKNFLFDLFHFFIFRKNQLIRAKGQLKLEVDMSKCTACLFCVDVCSADALRIEYEVKNDLTKNLTDFYIDHKKCFLCDDCVIACPDQALRLVNKNVEIYNIDSDDSQTIGHYTH